MFYSACFVRNFYTISALVFHFVLTFNINTMVVNRDVALLGASGAIVAATGASENDLNLVFWDTLAPSTTSRASVFCHEGSCFSLMA